MNRREPGRPPLSLQAPFTLACLFLTGSIAKAPLAARLAVTAPTLFADDFEHGLGAWSVAGEAGVTTHPIGGAHGHVLRLRPNGDVHALVRGSEVWGNVAIEGEVLFPDKTDAYLGVIYHFREQAGRSDFGLIYIKYGRRVYLQPNPHRDYNVSRQLYPEFEAPLSGAAAVRAGEWQRFRAEVMDGLCHFYVGDPSTPQLTFPIPEPGPGRIGLQPRSVGGEVWIDNVRVRALARFSYAGPPRPAMASPDPARLSWEVLGPLPRTEDDVARGTVDSPWRPFELDARGAVATGNVTDYHGPRAVAYFRTRVRSDSAGPALLHLSTIDDLALFVNGHFEGFIARGPAAWFDYWNNTEHEGQRYPIDLRAGENVLVLRVRGGSYASGGFYARVEKDGKALTAR